MTQEIPIHRQIVNVAGSRRTDDPGKVKPTIDDLSKLTRKCAHADVRKACRQLLDTLIPLRRLVGDNAPRRATRLSLLDHAGFGRDRGMKN